MSKEEKIEQVFTYVASQIDALHPGIDTRMLKVLCALYVLSHIEFETSNLKQAEVLRMVAHDFLCEDGLYHKDVLVTENRIFNWLAMDFGPEVL